MNTNQEKVASTINNLWETCKDGRQGYETAAENVDNPQLKSELTRLAQQRASFMSELQSSASQVGVTPPQTDTTLGGTVMEAAGAVHRGWINLKSVVTGHDNKAILSECENGDTAAIKAYEAAMQDTSIPASVKSLIEKQHHEIQAAKQKITALKQSI